MANKKNNVNNYQEDSKNTTSETKSKPNYKVLLIILVCVAAFIGLTFLLPNNGEVKKPKEYKVSQWVEDTKTKDVVTVLGLTTCGHCQAYKPVIESLSEDHEFNLYFFEIDTLEGEDYNTVLHTFNLENYADSVPFTFIIRNGEVVDDTTGYSSEENVVSFLKTNGIIK